MGGVLVVEVVEWEKGLDPSPTLIYIDMKDPDRAGALHNKGWARALWQQLRLALPQLRAVRLMPAPKTVDSLWGLAVEDLQDDIFNPPLEPRAQVGPPMCTNHPTFVTRSALGLHAVVGSMPSGQSAEGGEARAEGWRVHGCPRRSVAPYRLKCPQAPGSSSKTRRRGDGLFDIHANARYANKMLTSKPENGAIFARFLSDFALRAHCVVSSLVASRLCNFSSILDMKILFAFMRSLFLENKRGSAGSLTSVGCSVRSSNFCLLWASHGAADPTSGTSGRVHFRPARDIPSSSTHDVSAALAAPTAPPPSKTAVVAPPDTKTGATTHTANAPSMVKAACTPGFSITQRPAGPGTGASGSQNSP